MRGLLGAFPIELRNGFLKGLRDKVAVDKDLDLQIRENYINVYYKGNSLLKLSSKGDKYKVELHEKFIGDIKIPKELIDEASTEAFLRQIPFIKENIIRHGSSSIEIEYEQMIIRANNNESFNTGNVREFVINKVGSYLEILF